MCIYSFNINDGMFSGTGKTISVKMTIRPTQGLNTSRNVVGDLPGSQVPEQVNSLKEIKDISCISLMSSLVY